MSQLSEVFSSKYPLKGPIVIVSLSEFYYIVVYMKLYIWIFRFIQCIGFGENYICTYGFIFYLFKNFFLHCGFEVNTNIIHGRRALQSEGKVLEAHYVPRTLYLYIITIKSHLPPTYNGVYALKIPTHLGSIYNTT